MMLIGWNSNVPRRYSTSGQASRAAKRPDMNMERGHIKVLMAVAVTLRPTSAFRAELRSSHKSRGLLSCSKDASFVRAYSRWIACEGHHSSDLIREIQ
jgi:hypothetical protein